MSSLPSCSCSSASSLDSSLKTLNFSLSSRFSQMGLCQLNPWNGLRHMGISISPRTPNLGRRAKCRGKVVYASLFGVGAPEALVIGAVALLVFGPKGLAEVAKNLGKTLRTFQPTIRELQDVSREFKSTLEREIGLDDDLSSARNTYGSSRTNTSRQFDSSLKDSSTVADPNGTLPNNAYSSEEYLKITEEQLKASAIAQQSVASLPPESEIKTESQPQDNSLLNNAYSSEEYLKVTEEQLKASAATPTQQDVSSSPEESQTEVKSQPQAVVQETVSAVPPVQKPESET